MEFDMKKSTELTVLVVDDVPLTRKMVCDSLLTLGISNTTQAPNGKTALGIVRERSITHSQNPFDLILCDWNMPELSGIELLKEVRKIEAARNIPFILITSEVKKENVVEAMEAGVAGYIVKPFSTTTIREKITKSIPNLTIEEPKIK
jgi:two-component system chemotaxis response regulator CheY